MVARAVLIAVAVAASWTEAAAADPASRHAEQNGVASRPIGVLIDETFVRATGCPQGRDCIAPRILPVDGSAKRRVDAIAYPVAVDPRFTDLYRR